MTIPTYEQLLTPLLALATHQDIVRRIVKNDMADFAGLTEEERESRIPSGRSTYIGNRTGWAMTYLKKAGLIEKVAKATYRATPFGVEFLENHPNGIKVKDLKKINGWKKAWTKDQPDGAAISKNNESEQDDANPDMTPEEAIDLSIEELQASLRSEILELLSEIDPYRFEQVVIDVLFAMGYGGSREEAAKVTQKSNDGGIDGVINEDRLGLDVIYVQAKRWKNSIGREDIQKFVGALAGKQASKGVFITTSEFKKTATEYTDTVSQKVILIDGSKLADLMIEYDVGVSTVRSVSLKRIDSDYFD